MNGFFAALTFLTILPGPKKQAFPGSGMLGWFPLIGLVVGSLFFLSHWGFSAFFPSSLASLLSVLFLTVITGGLHLDGLADTADGLFSHRSREDALRIMKDSSIGVMGSLALFFVLGLKWMAIDSIDGGGWQSWIWFVLPPAYARAAMLAGTYFLPYARKEGTGKDFVVPGSGVIRFSGLPVLLVLPLVSGKLSIFLWMTTVFLLVTASVLFLYKRKIGGITGDMLGALGEMTETALFLAGAFLNSGLRISE